MQRVNTSCNAGFPLGTFLYIIPQGGRRRPALITEAKKSISAHYRYGSGAWKLITCHQNFHYQEREKIKQGKGRRVFLVFSPSCFNILEQTKITVLGVMNKARLPHACSEVQRPSRGNPSTLASPGKCPLPLPPGREHTHTTGKESMRRFRLKFYPHQLKNLPTES